MPVRNIRRLSTVAAWIVILAVAVASTAAGCGKVAPPDQIFVDNKAEQKKHTCLAWEWGGPREILTDAAHGGADRKTLAVFLLREWRDEDPDSLREATNSLHDAASRLQRGDNPDAVLADAERAMATTDDWYARECPPIVAAEGRSTTTTVER